MNKSNADILQKLGVDIDQTLNRFMGMEDFYFKMLRKFPADPSFMAIEESVQNKDAEGVFLNAHTLKGVCANLGLTNLYNASSDLTECYRGKNQILPEGMALYEIVKDNYWFTIEQLKEIN